MSTSTPKSIRWHKAALRDLEEIVAFIAQDKPAAAKRFAESVFAKVEMLATSPLLGWVSRCLPSSLASAGRRPNAERRSAAAYGNVVRASKIHRRQRQPLKYPGVFIQVELGRDGLVCRCRELALAELAVRGGQQFDGPRQEARHAVDGGELPHWLPTGIGQVTTSQVAGVEVDHGMRSSRWSEISVVLSVPRESSC